MLNDCIRLKRNYIAHPKNTVTNIKFIPKTMFFKLERCW